MYIPINWLRPYFLPVLLIALSVIALPYASDVTSSQKEMLWLLPYIISTVTLVLGQKFIQGRLSFAVANIVLGYMLIQFYMQEPLIRNQVTSLYCLLSVFWPLNMFIIYWLPERNFISRVGLILASVFIVQALIIYILLNFVPQHYAWLQQTLPLSPIYYPDSIFSHWIIPSYISYLILALTLIMAAHAFYQQNRTSIALFSSFILLVLTLGWFDLSDISTLFTSMAALGLLITLVMNSHDLAFLDELTGLPGRRALSNALKHVGKNYTLVMADIDKFKLFNDKHGHETGDDVLKLVAHQLSKVTGGGKVYRYGGEEFTLMFNNKSSEQCHAHVESLRASIANYPMVLRDKNQRPQDQKLGEKLRKPKPKRAQKVKVTMSFGIAQKQNGQSTDEVMKLADKALYKAKENGRNRVEG